ncbi:MAG: TMEM165/GDT1 family protein [Firmicutes bacterium]|nr:TMEM165/GDT1 family protein [Bacillota bacterium]
MLYEMGKAASFIFIAELGDKTQILAMTFALQFSIRQVLAGVALGSFLNHGVAVIIGAYLAHIIPLSTIRLGSALLFLGFGLWTLASKGDEEHNPTKSAASPILVVALAFFIGELGDKTQLTAIALASNAVTPWAILVGTVIGMVLTSLVAIIVGSKLGERIPDFTLKIVSGSVFIGFGLVHLIQTVPSRFLTLPNVTLFVLVLVSLLAYLVVPLVRERRGQETELGALRTAAGQLHALEKALGEICLDEERCRNENCPVGYCKQLIKEELRMSSTGGPGREKPRSVRQPYVKREQAFDRRRVDQVLQMLETMDLRPAIRRELKENLEKLLR